MIFLGWIVIACTVCTNCKSTSTRWKSGLRCNTRQTSYLLGVLHCMYMWATLGHHYVDVDYYYSKLPVTGCRPSDVQSMLGWQGWSCPRVSYHAFERPCACFFSYDISWYEMIVLHIHTNLVWVDDPASRVLLARAAQQWGKQAAQWIRWLPCLHLRHYRAVLK